MKEINRNDFEHLTATYDGLAVIDFWAPWCGPCLRMAPIYQVVSETPEFKEIQFLKINTDDHLEFREAFGFRTIPSFYLVRFTRDGKFDQGNILEYLGGSQLPDEMIAKIQRHLE